MTLKAIPKILTLIFHSLVPLRRGNQFTQTLGQGMGSAHALNAIHTGRNPVFCQKVNNSKYLIGSHVAALPISEAAKFVFEAITYQYH